MQVNLHAGCMKINKVRKIGEFSTNLRLML